MSVSTLDSGALAGAVDLFDRANKMVVEAAEDARHGASQHARDLRRYAAQIRDVAANPRPGFDCDDCLISVDTTDAAEAQLLSDIHGALSNHSRDITTNRALR